MLKILVAELADCEPAVLLGSWSTWASMVRDLTNAHNNPDPIDDPINVHVLPLGDILRSSGSHVATLTFDQFGQVQATFLQGHSKDEVL